MHLQSGRFLASPSALQADQRRGRATLQLGSRSGRRLGSPPQRRARRDTEEDVDGDAVDRISDLPVDLRLVVLSRLRCAREAARASVLSRGWRDAGLWTRLPELWFTGVDLDTLERALAEVTRRELDRVVVRLVGSVTPERASWLLHAAQRLAPEKLAINGAILSHFTEFTTKNWEVIIFLRERDRAIELPCLKRTTTLELGIPGLRLTPPMHGEFMALQVLRLHSVSVDAGPGALLPLCPCLRVLDMRDVHISGTLTVHSTTLEVLVMRCAEDVHQINIVAPKLGLLDLNIDMAQEFRASFSAPVGEKLLWECRNRHQNVGFGEMWQLVSISQGVRGVVYYVSLQLRFTSFYRVEHISRSLEQEIAQLPVPNFAALELCFLTVGHVIGPLVLHLLRRRPAVQFLKISYKYYELGEDRGHCYDYCPCQQPNEWGSQSISLTDLLEVDFVGFQGEDHEFDLLKLLFRSAALLQIMILRVGANLSSSSSRYRKICRIFKKYPHVSCYVYRIGSEEVLYP